MYPHPGLARWIGWGWPSVDSCGVREGGICKCQLQTLAGMVDNNARQGPVQLFGSNTEGYVGFSHDEAHAHLNFMHVDILI